MSNSWDSFGQTDDLSTFFVVQNVGTDWANADAGLATTQALWHIASDNDGENSDDERFFRVKENQVAAAAGLFSIATVFWLFRGGAVVTALAGAGSSWRLVDPAALLTATQAEKDQIDKLVS